MIRGIGIDMVSIAEVKRLCAQAEDPKLISANPFVTRTFSEREIVYARECPDAFEALAGLFAVKEATFKAVAHLLPEKQFDMRMVETLHGDDGCPSINAGGRLSDVLERAGVEELLVSITNEDGMAAAVVLAQ